MLNIMYVNVYSNGDINRQNRRCKVVREMIKLQLYKYSQVFKNEVMYLHSCYIPGAITTVKTRPVHIISSFCRERSWGLGTRLSVSIQISRLIPYHLSKILHADRK